MSTIEPEALVKSPMPSRKNLHDHAGIDRSHRSAAAETDSDLSVPDRAETGEITLDPDKTVAR
jgi:hypothetical protein